MNYKPIEYFKSGFRLNNNRVIYGFVVLIVYTYEFIKYHIKKEVQ